MYEVEVKVPAIHGAVRERLADLDASRQGVVRQVDTYFDAPHRNFAESDEALRLRREVRIDRPGDAPADEATLLTYKGPLVEAESKTREEVESLVDDAVAMCTLLERLGFEAAATVEKERERWTVGDYTVSLDAVDGLGEFVEVELAAESVEPARKGAVAVLRDLGLDPEDQIRTSYLGLLLESGPGARGDN